MDLAALLYNYERGVLENKEAIVKIVVENSMTPLYQQLCTKFNWELDQSVVDTLKYDIVCEVIWDVLFVNTTSFRVANEEELKAIELKREDASTNAGDMEVTYVLLMQTGAKGKEDVICMHYTTIAQIGLGQYVCQGAVPGEDRQLGRGFGCI